MIQEPHHCGHLPYCSVFHLHLLSLNILFSSALSKVSNTGSSDDWLLIFRPCNPGGEVKRTVKEQGRGNTTIMPSSGHHGRR